MNETNIDNKQYVKADDDTEKSLEQTQSPQKIITKVKIDDKTTVVHSTDGIYEEIKRDGAPFKRSVFYGSIMPLERLNVDGHTYFKYKANTEQINTMQEISQKLRREGGVLSRNRLDDCLNAIFLNLKETIGHATYGVYENGDDLSLCLDAMPIKDNQEKFSRRSQSSISQPLTRGSVEAYLKTIKYWHPYEILPNMGLFTISPFALLLRKKEMLIPITYNFSPHSHLGKSTIQKIFSQSLFSIYTLSGDEAKTNFRFASIMDSICGPVVIDEVDNVDFSELSDLIKNSCENPICTGRGTKELKMEEFLSRAVIGINGNRFKITNKSTMVRVLKIEFDMKSISMRSDQTKIDSLTKLKERMLPIGWRLVELELESIGCSLENLLKNIKEHEHFLKDQYNGWMDSRRSTSWAVCYEGLKMWELAAKKFDIDWEAPSYTEFIANVILKVEETSKSTTQQPIADFIQWWEMWKAKNTRHWVEKDGGYSIQHSEIPGENKIWAEKKIIIRGVECSGDVVTNPVLREYLKERTTTLDSLADIASTVAMKQDTDKSKILKNWDIGGKTRWGVFIPNAVWDKQLKEELKGQKAA